MRAPRAPAENPGGASRWALPGDLAVGVAVLSAGGFCLVALLALTTVEPARVPLALAALVALLGLVGVTLVAALQGRPRPAAWWVLPLTAALTYAPLPLVGRPWLNLQWTLACVALLVLPARCAAPAFVAVVAAGLPLGAAFGVTFPTSLYVVSTALLALTPYVFVRVTHAARDLEDARAELAELAVRRERARITATLDRSLGATLAEVARRGEQAQAVLRRDPGWAAEELRALVELTRRSAADVRRAGGNLRRPSLRGALEQAAWLLEADGVPCAVTLADSDLGPAVEDRLVAGVGAGVTAVLRATGVTCCTIRVDQRHAVTRLVFAGGDGRVHHALEIPAEAVLW